MFVLVTPVSIQATTYYLFRLACTSPMTDECLLVYCVGVSVSFLRNGFRLRVYSGSLSDKSPRPGVGTKPVKAAAADFRAVRRLA